MGHCYKCSGTGTVESSDRSYTRSCPHCGGRGYTDDPKPSSSSSYSSSSSSYSSEAAQAEADALVKPLNKAIDLKNKGYDLMNSDKRASGEAFGLLVDMLTSAEWEKYVRKVNTDYSYCTEVIKRIDKITNELEDIRFHANSGYSLSGFDKGENGDYNGAIEDEYIALNYASACSTPEYQKLVTSGIEGFLALHYKGRGDEYFYDGDKEKAIADYKVAAIYGGRRESDENLDYKDAFDRLAELGIVDYEPTVDEIDDLAWKEYNAKHYAASFYLYSKTAEKNSPQGLCNLGYFLANGFGCVPNPKKGFELTKKAAELGFVQAIANMGLFYQNGLGVSQNFAKAEEWLLKAKAKGHEQADELLKKLKQEKPKGGGCMSSIFALICAVSITGLFADTIVGFGGIIFAAVAVAGFIAWRTINWRFRLALIALVVVSFLCDSPAKKQASRITSAVSSMTAQTVTVTADALNMRTSPDGNADVVKSIPKGAVLTVTGEAQNNWLPVSHEGASGWVSKRYVSDGSGQSQKTEPSAQTQSAQPAQQQQAQTQPAEPTGNYGFTMAKDVYAPNEVITVNYTVSQKMVQDQAWVALYRANAAHANYGEYRYLSTPTGEVRFSAPAEQGAWEMRLYKQYSPYTDETLVMKKSFRVE